MVIGIGDVDQWFVGSIAIWKKSARLRSELPSSPPVEICPVWFTWSVAWLRVKTGVIAWPVDGLRNEDVPVFG